MKMLRTWLILLVGTQLIFATVIGSDAEPASPTKADHSSHHEHLNHIAVFLGLTAGGENEHHGKEDAALTIGFDYERRLTDRWGVGVLGDMAFGDRREFIMGFPVFLHVGKSAKFLIAPGFERTKGDGHHDAHSEFLMRFGCAYDVHLKKITLSPAFNVDLLENEAIYVLGVNIGWGF